MKLTKTYLFDLIKEELETVLSEQPTKPLGYGTKSTPADTYNSAAFSNLRDKPEMQTVAKRRYLNHPGMFQKAASLADGSLNDGDFFNKSTTEKSVDFLLDAAEGYLEELDRSKREGQLGGFDGGHEWIRAYYEKNKDFIVNDMKFSTIKPTKGGYGKEHDMRTRFEEIVRSILRAFEGIAYKYYKERSAAIAADYDRKKAAYDAEQKKDREDYEAARARGDYTNKLPAGSRVNRDLRKVSDYLKSSSKRSTPSVSDPARAASVGSRMGGLNEEKKNKNQLILEGHRENRKVHPVAKDNWWYDA